MVYNIMWTMRAHVRLNRSTTPRWKHIASNNFSSFVRDTNLSGRGFCSSFVWQIDSQSVQSRGSDHRSVTRVNHSTLINYSVSMYYLLNIIIQLRNITKIINYYILYKIVNICTYWSPKESRNWKQHDLYNHIDT